MNAHSAHWPVWGLLSLPIYSPQYSRIVLVFCSAIILSGGMNSWLWRLHFHFLESFEISKFMYTHRLMFKSGFVTALQLRIFRVSCSYLSQLLALISARILLITVSFLKISSWEITHFPWSWSDHITLNLHFSTNICHKSSTQTVCLSIFGDSTCRFKMLM